VSVFQGWQGLNHPKAISKASRGLKRNLPPMHQSAISLGYDVCMETNQDFITYKSVNIFNVRNMATGNSKIAIRDIAVTYLADKFTEGSDSVRSVNSLPKAKAMIDWLLANGATVVDGRIVTTMGDMETCQYGCPVRKIQNYTQFMKGGK